MAENFYKISIGILVLLLSWVLLTLNRIKSESVDQLDSLKKSIIASDSLIRESEGRYSKLVDYYHTEKELKNELKDSNRELYEIIKKQNERILILSNSIVTLKSAISEGFGSIDKADTNLIDLALTYPTEKDPFIKWDGFIRKDDARYKGQWTFGKLPIQILVTEESRGLWKHRIVGPDWFIVDSLDVKSLPPDKFPPAEKKLQYLLGASYLHSLNNANSGSIGVGVGLNIINQHSLILSATTNQEVGLSYYYKFKSVKRTK